MENVPPKISFFFVALCYPNPNPLTQVLHRSIARSECAPGFQSPRASLLVWVSCICFCFGAHRAVPWRSAVKAKVVKVKVSVRLP